MPASPAHVAVDLYSELLGLLRRWGIKVVHAVLHDHDATWDPGTSTLHLRRDAPLCRHVRLLEDFVQLVTGGPTRATPLRRRPRLTLVT